MNKFRHIWDKIEGIMKAQEAPSMRIFSIAKGLRFLKDRGIIHDYKPLKESHMF